MAQRYIYISDILNERLKKEGNASGLIQRLLRNYYNIDHQEKIDKIKAEIKAEEEGEEKEKAKINSLLLTSKESFNINLNEEQVKEYLIGCRLGAYCNIKDFLIEKRLILLEDKIDSEEEEKKKDDKY